MTAESGSLRHVEIFDAGAQAKSIGDIIILVVRYMKNLLACKSVECT